MGADSDAINPLVIAATMDEVPDADIYIGTFGAYMTVGYARATEWLPFYREVWEVIPWVLWMASLALFVWAAWHTVGNRAAVLTGVLGLCVSPWLLYLLSTSSYHTWTVYSSAIAVGLVVFLANQTHMSIRAWIVAVAATFVLGGALASDQLVLLGAIGPLVVAGAGVAIRHATPQGRIVGLVAGVVATGAIAIAAGLTQIMEASGFVVTPRTEGWIDAHLFFSQTGAFLEETLWMLNGHFFGRPLSIESALSFATALGVVVALAAPFIVLRRRLQDTSTTGTPLELGQSAYIFFWAATMAIVPLLAIASDQNIIRRAYYFLPVAFAAAATVPLLARRSATGRYLVIGGVSVYAVLGVLTSDLHNKGEDLEGLAGRVGTQANELISIARQEQAQVGYAGYWEAASSTWSTKMQVKVFPVEHDCGAPGGAPCPNSFNVHRGWYVPRGDIRTFLIGPTEDADSYEPPASLGPPLATHRLLNGTHLYVYPYDIAARFGPFEPPQTE